MFANHTQHLGRLAVVFLLLAVVLPATLGFAASNDVVISQVYGGGGNAGATYKNDFIELFNRSTAPVSLAGWSVQYASATGTSWSTTPLTGTIQPGHYYLVQEFQGAGGTVNLPTPDDSGTLSLSASAGKVALVSSRTALTGSCPSTAATVVDFVGFGTGGSGASCFEGSGPTATLTNTTAALRRDVCADGNNNNADFKTDGPPNPRNTVSPTTYCVPPTDPKLTTKFTSSTVDAGLTTLLTATVVPGSSPTSSGVVVTAGLGLFNGSAAQALFDDGTNGDLVANDNVYSFLLTVPVATAPGSYSVTVTLRDDQLRTAQATAALTVTVPAQPAAIHDIQGAGARSTLENRRVVTSGIVTAVAGNGFYIEAPPEEQDQDPSTSEGVFVYTGARPTVSIADKVEVTGTVSEYPSTSTTPATEITAPTVTVLGSGYLLPPAIDIDPAPSGTLDQLERYEGMRVHVSSPQVVGPSGIKGTATDGVFYVTSGTVPRPFREPGIEPGAPDPGFPAGVPRFDGNPERILIDTSQYTCALASVAVGDTIPDIVGPLGYSAGSYTIYPESSFTAVSQAHAVPLPDRADREFTVASFNMLSFSSTNTTRLAKASAAIRDIMRMPDIIGLEEVDKQSSVDALASRINIDASAGGQGNPGYVGVLLADSGTQNVGFLYRSNRLQDVSVTELGANATFPDPRNNGSPAPTNDRPPLVLMAKLTPPAGQPFPVTVIVNHLRSLISVDDAGPTGLFVRAKRQAGAEFLANLIAQHQLAGDHVISVGDYNAFEFNDGYVDVLGTVTGRPTGPEEVLLASPDLVSPALTDLAMTLPPARRYSYVESGNAQTLDHIVVTGDLLARPYHLEIAHNNAEFPKTLSLDGSRPERVSDHDMPVAYFTFPPLQADLQTTITASSSTVTSGSPQRYTVTVANLGPDAARDVTLVQSLPDHAAFQSLSVPADWTCTTPAIGGTGKISCRAGLLDAAAGAQFTVDVAIGCDTRDGANLNTVVEATTATLDPQSANNTASYNTTVSNPPPVISGLSVDKPILSPPNHKLIPVLLSYKVTDNCDTALIPIVSVTSNQPLNGTGDGNTAVDWQLIDSNNILLRAERAPTGAAGRTYTVTVTATDSAGYSTAQSVDVQVPR